jgi:SPP1 family predicted phage head-tail adaptor
MLKKKPLPTYNDGVVSIYRDKCKKIDFNSRDSALENLEFVAKLLYEEKSCREQDFNSAKLRGFSLSVKIRIHFCRDVDSDCKAIIGEDLFGISHIEKTKREMYLYLSSVGKVKALK